MSYGEQNATNAQQNKNSHPQGIGTAGSPMSNEELDNRVVCIISDEIEVLEYKLALLRRQLSLLHVGLEAKRLKETFARR